jgi:hypothetical protein
MDPDSKDSDQAVIAGEDSTGLPLCVPESGDAGEGGKLKMVVQLVKKCLGVKDIASMFVANSPW